MKIAFKKIPTNGIDFETAIEGLKFSGIAKKRSKKLVECQGQIDGAISHLCDRCGDEFELSIKEDIKVYAHEGLYESDADLLNVIEFFDDFINFDIMLESEIGTIVSDYYYCSTCKENN